MRQITDIDEGTIRRVDWQELIPLTMFFRAFSATFKPSFLALGAFLLAFFATIAGFLQQRPSHEVVDTSVPSKSMTLSKGSGKTTGLFCPVKFQWQVETLSGNDLFPTTFTGSASRLFMPTLILGGLVACWYALALSRTTVVRLTSSARSSTCSSLLFATKKFRSLLLPLVFLILFAAALWLSMFGVYKTGVFGRICAPIFVLVEWGLVVVILLLGLSFPLNVSAIAAENSDGFDATSRGISYLTQRPLFWLLYYFVALVLVVLGAAIVETITSFCLVIFDTAYEDAFGLWIPYWRFAILAMPAAYCFNAVVVYSNAIYILLRRSVDGTPFDSCVLDLTPRKPRQLRQILQDGKGAPVFDETSKEQVKSSEETKDV